MNANMNLPFPAKTALALLLLSSSLGWCAAQPYTPTDCIRQFTAFNFQGLNFTRYDEYYDDSSTFTLAQTGVYTGADAIEEYVSFVVPETTPTYWESRENFERQFGFVPGRFDPDAGLCVFSFVSSQSLTFNSEFTNGDTLNFAAYRNIFYSIPDDNIQALTLYYDPSIIAATFSGLDTPAVRNFVCGILNGESCTDALGMDPKSPWQEERDVEKCEKRLARLPVLEGVNGDYADGNTQGCRVLHASFAVNNPFHCAHLAFEPTEDPAGVVKCQVSGIVLF